MKQASMYSVSDVPTPSYIVDVETFKTNLIHLRTAFKTVYGNYRIGYSYKTNYFESFLQAVSELGEYAEVVSPYEYDIARNGLNVEPRSIIYNGVVDDFTNKMAVAKAGGIVHVDSINEFRKFVEVSSIRNKVNVGVRLNFDIGNGIQSRFGIDTEGDDFRYLADTSQHPYVRIVSVHYHMGEARSLDFFRTRIRKLIAFSEVLGADTIDVGGNMCGPMHPSYRQQFGQYIPTFEEYAEVIAGEMKRAFPDERKTLITENGTALVANAVDLLATIIGIKAIHGTTFITLDTKMHDVGSACVSKSPAYEHYGADTNKVEHGVLVGSTCLDIDRIVRDYNAPANIGDKVLLRGVGAYSNNSTSHWITGCKPYMFFREDIAFGTAKIAET